MSCKKPPTLCSSLFMSSGAARVTQPPSRARRDIPAPAPAPAQGCGQEPAKAGTWAAFPRQQLPPPRTQTEEDPAGGRREQRLQTQLVLIASAIAKQLMAGRRRGNRALGERKGHSKQGETICSFPKERGTIYSRSCSCGGLTRCIPLAKNLLSCTQTTNTAFFML